MKKYKIRKLTPRECGRLMGVDDKDIDVMLNADLSDNAIYKMCGNSIVVDCMVYIFGNLFINKKEDKITKKLW